MTIEMRMMMMMMMVMMRSVSDSLVVGIVN